MYEIVLTFCAQRDKMYQLITLEAAGAILTVCVGLAILVIVAAGALTWLKTRVAPHADCLSVNDALLARMDAYEERAKRAAKSPGGIARQRPPVDPAPDPSAAAPEDLSLQERRAAVRKLAAASTMRRVG